MVKKSNKITNNIMDKIIVYLKSPLVWISIFFLISVIILIIISRGHEKYFCDLETHDYIPIYGCLLKCPPDKSERCGKTCYDPANQKCLSPDNLCNTCEGECCSGSCVKDPVNTDKKICCDPEQLCIKEGQPTQCCGAGLVCVNGNCVPKCAPLNKSTIISEDIQPSAINLSDGTITVKSNDDKWIDKMEITITSSGNLPTPLTSDSSYYIIRIDNTKIKLANSPEDVDSKTSITFTNSGTGVITITSIIFNRICGPGEECYLMSNILKNSTTYKTIKSEMESNPKIQEYPGIDSNHSDFYTCKVKPNCSYLQAPFAVPPAINNKYPSFNLQIPNGNTEFCSIKNANKDSSVDDAKYCYNTYNSKPNLCNQDPKCQWYDLMKTTKDNVGQINSAILKITQENDGLYCGKEGQRLFGKTEESNSKCLPTDCFIGIANSQTKQINYDPDTKTCLALLDSKKPVDGSQVLGNYQLIVNNNQLKTIDLSNMDVDTNQLLNSQVVKNYPYMPDCSETDKVNQLCSKTDATYSFVANSSEECQTDSGTLIQPSQYCSQGSTYQDGKCVCINNGKKWDPNSYNQDKDSIPNCTTSLCYKTGGQRCQINPYGYCNNGKAISFLGNSILNTDNPDCVCNPAYKGKTCTTLVSMRDLFGTTNNIIPSDIAQEMINSGIVISEGVFVLPGPGVIIDDGNINIQYGYPVDINAEGRTGIKDFLTEKWPNKWGCGRGYLFMNRNIFDQTINLYITSRNMFNNNTSLTHSFSYQDTDIVGRHQTRTIHKFETGACGNENPCTHGDNIVFFNSDNKTQAAVIIIGAT